MDGDKIILTTEHTIPSKIVSLPTESKDIDLTRLRRIPTGIRTTAFKTHYS